MTAIASKENAARQGGEIKTLQNDFSPVVGHLLPMHTFRDATSKIPMTSACVTLAEAAKALHNVKHVRCKADAPLVTFNDYVPGAQSRRVQDILCSHAVCGDIDHNFDQAIFDAGLEELVNLGVPIIAYQTYSHTAQAPRWRIFIFLDEPALHGEYTACWHGLNDLFGGMLDAAAKDSARLNYWPSCPPSQTRDVLTFNMGGRPPKVSIKQALVKRGSAHVSDGKQALILGIPFDVPAYIRHLSARDDNATAAILRLQEYEEIPNNIAWVQSLLECVSANSDYREWRNIVWATASLGWSCGERLCRDWSMTGAKFIEADFRSTWDSYRDGGIGIGTLIRRAKLGGWKPAMPLRPVNTVPNMNSTPTPPAPAPSITAALTDKGWQAPKEFKLISRDDLHSRPALRWRIKGVLPERGLAGLYGPSTSGKSFLAFDMACAIAEGQPWFGHRVIAAPVVYVALEGEAGFKTRSQAWEQHHARKQPANFFMVLQPFNLIDEVDALANVIPPGAVVVIDTLNRAAPTADENSSKDMGAILEGAKRLQAVNDGLVVVVHHTGKDATKGLRGHSSLFAALDAAIEVSRDEEYREWRVAKSKDGADGATHPFRLELKSLGQDEYGDGITSCVVVPDTTGGEIRRAKVPRGGNQRVVYDALREVLKATIPNDPDAPACVPAAHPAVELGAVLPRIADRLTCEKRRRTTSARAALTGLVNRGVILFEEDWLWIP